MAVIQTAGLTKEYRLGFQRKRVLVLDRLDLEVKEGEIFGFLGPNGAGKTTTMKILMEFIRPTAGRAWLLGEEIGRVPVRQRIGFLPEAPYFYDYLTAEEFLSFYGRLFGLDARTIEERTERLLSQVGLEGSRTLQLRKFSKGMLQRIGLAQALINDPQLVILDEPMSGLDPVGRKEVRDLILQLKSQGKTVFFSSHIIHDVEVLCDRVAILVKGRLHNVGRLSDIIDAKVKYIEITASRIDRAAAQTFERLGATIDVSGETVLVRVANEQSVDAVLAMIRELKGALVSVLPVKETLEEYFIRAARNEG